MPGEHKRWFRQKTWTRAWGVFTFPESLDSGNRNLAFITGLEAASAFVRPKGKLQYVPPVPAIPIEVRDVGHLELC